jgi:hypothetical protein
MNKGSLGVLSKRDRERERERESNIMMLEVEGVRMRKGEPSGGMGTRWQQPTTFRAKRKPVIPTSERSPEGADYSVVATLVRLAKPYSLQRFPLTRSPRIGKARTRKKGRGPTEGAFQF